jgi:hypothetical protein
MIGLARPLTGFDGEGICANNARFRRMGASRQPMSLVLTKWKQRPFFIGLTSYMWSLDAASSTDRSIVLGRGLARLEQIGSGHWDF